MRKFLPCLFAVLASALAAAAQSLSPAQLTTLKNGITANANVMPAGQPYAGTAVKDVPHNDDGAAAVAWWYGQAAAGPYRVWHPQANLKDIRSAVDMSKFTPTDPVPANGTTTTVTNNQLVYQNQALVCQLKQANAIFLISGEGQIDCSSLQLRQSFNDCLTGIPSGASGAATNAAWGTPASPGAVRLAMMRPATWFEKLYAVQSAGAGASGVVSTDPRGGTTNPDTLVVSGSLSGTTVLQAWNQ